jgi:hypothetical protein
VGKVSEAPLAVVRFLQWMLRGKQETCESCQNSFTCGPGVGTCWCANENIPRNALQELKKKYHRCLCPTCLRKAGQSGVS